MSCRKRLSALDALLQALGRASSHSALGMTRGMVSNGIRRSAPGFVAVDGEGDADAVEQQVGLAALLGNALGRGFGEPVGERAEMRAHLAIGRAHLVVMPAFH